MNFGPPFICPPYYYLLIFPTPIYPSSSNSFPESKELNITCSAETINFSECSSEEKIIVTKEDLLEEGYEQTKKAWTEEQDKLLLQLCSNKQLSFEEVAASMPNRNSKMCYSRYRRLIHHAKDYWSKAEDSKLLSLVEKYGQNWRAFESYFPKRNFKQLKDHYENYLCPGLKKDEWTVQDDLLLIKLINRYGKNWKLIEQMMSGRSRNQLKNRFFGRIKRINARKLTSGEGNEIIQGNKLSLSPI